MRTKQVLFYILLILNSLAFIFSGGGKLIGLEEAIKQNQLLNLEIWFIKLIGFFEVLGVIGLWLTKFRPYVAICLMVIMMGAIGTHIGAAQPQNVVPATALFIFLSFVLILDKNNNIILESN